MHLNAARALRLPALLLLLTPAFAQQDERIDKILAQIEALTAELNGLTVTPVAPVGPTTAAQRLAWWDDHVALREASPYQDGWRFLGPTNISGRVTDLAVCTPRGETYRIYAATASGGVWRSDNDGTSWSPIFDDAVTTSIGALALDPSDQDVLWVGTGEANIFRSSMAGCGVYLTRDGGETWEHKGLGETHTIARMIVHPADSNTVYVAASGNEWTDNPERGVYKTTDGGATWDLVLHVDESSGAIDLVLDPSDPNRIYAATWERRRLLWNDPRNTPQSDGSGVWRSTDGGESWVAINEGLPVPSERGRIGIDLCDAQPNTLYAFVDHYGEIETEGTDSYGRATRGGIFGATVFRSDDHGDHWERVSPDDAYMRRLSATYGWVFGQMRVDPSDPDTLYLMGLGLNVSNDGGKSFRRLRGMHGDHHALWIDPRNPKYLINGNDGGTAISHDGGESWDTSESNLPVVQFYNLAIDTDDPFTVYGSVQDHGSFSRSIDMSRGLGRVRPGEWERAPGGEASFQAADPTDPNTVYAESFYGSIFRQDMSSGERVSLRPTEGEGQPPLRGQWLAPFVISPHNPRILYHGMNRLFRSWDRGENLQPISPDLSHADPAQIGDIPYQTITSISESAFQFGKLFVGTDDGRLHRTEDGGDHWTDITAGVAKARWISRVVASRYDEDVVWCAQNGKRNDDFSAYLWRSSDGGTTWVDRSAGIPSGPINVVAEDPVAEGVVYVGTDLGVYVSKDHGATWTVLGADLPSTFVHDLVVHPEHGVLLIATHGRGMWAIDVRDLQGRGEAEVAPEEPEITWSEEEEEDDD
ncbi:MAG: hypothetical protein O2816_19295 [Planctomycetota bacterium]|nr:hypothetical protein [Planctomycetota bacterium]